MPKRSLAGNYRLSALSNQYERPTEQIRNLSQSGSLPSHRNHRRRPAPRQKLQSRKPPAPGSRNLEFLPDLLLRFLRDRTLRRFEFSLLRTLRFREVCPATRVITSNKDSSPSFEYQPFSRPSQNSAAPPPPHPTSRPRAAPVSIQTATTDYSDTSANPPNKPIQHPPPSPPSTTPPPTYAAPAESNLAAHCSAIHPRSSPLGSDAQSPHHTSLPAPQSLHSTYAARSAKDSSPNYSQTSADAELSSPLPQKPSAPRAPHRSSPTPPATPRAYISTAPAKTANHPAASVLPVSLPSVQTASAFPAQTPDIHPPPARNPSENPEAPTPPSCAHDQSTPRFAPASSPPTRRNARYAPYTSRKNQAADTARDTSRPPSSRRRSSQRHSANRQRAHKYAPAYAPCAPLQE